MQVKLFSSTTLSDIERQVNEYLNGQHPPVKEIRFSTTTDTYDIMIILYTSLL